MATTATTTTMLWTRARGLCSRCKRDLAPLIGGQATLAGFQAHITADSPGGPRYDGSLTTKQRDDYANLILLCGSCHAEVDKLEGQFTIAMLHSIKAEHERDCSSRLTIDDERRAIRGDVLSNAVDLIVEGLKLERWDEWTAEIINPGSYRWPRWAFGEYRLHLRPAIEAVLWPSDITSLEISSKMLIDAMMALRNTFCLHSSLDREDHDFFVCRSMEVMEVEYRGSDPGFERALLHWDETLELGLVHVAKCVNWFAEAVREHVAPRFRIRSGAFIVEPSKFEPGAHGVYVFTPAEKGRLLEKGCVRVDEFDPWALARDSWLPGPKANYAPREGTREAV